MLELGDGAEDLEEHPTDRRRGVDALVQHHEVDTPGFKLAGQGDQVLEGAAKAVELGDHQLVAGAGDTQRVVERRPSGQLAAGLVDEDFVAAGGFEGVVLAVGVLVTGRDSAVADTHADTVSRTGLRVT